MERRFAAADGSWTAAAGAALIRVAHHYGSRPEFVVLGGLVPELLCANSDLHRAGTTDVEKTNADACEQLLRCWTADWEGVAAAAGVP